MKIDKATVRNIAQKAFNEVLAELGGGPKDNIPGFTDDWDKEPNGGAFNPQIPDTHRSINQDDIIDKNARSSRFGNKLSTAASKLAQLKGELATVLDRAERENVISRDGGKIKIINLPTYQQMIGNLPQQIKILRDKALGESL